MCLLGVMARCRPARAEVDINYLASTGAVPDRKGRKVVLSGVAEEDAANCCMCPRENILKPTREKTKRSRGRKEKNEV